MATAGKRLAELTGAEWGIVSAGCAAGMAHATAACVAGGNPDLHVRIPNLSRLSQGRGHHPHASRNVYDAAIRAVGVKIIEVDSLGGPEAAIGPKTAHDLHLSGGSDETGPMSTEAIAAIAKPHNVPVLVDAAAEDPHDPEHPPAARRDARRLQRRQVHPRSAKRRPAARPQGPGPGRMGAQRAAPRLRARDESGPRRDRRHARRRRELGQTRPRGRMEAVGRPLRAHRRPRLEDCRRHRQGAARAGRSQQSQPAPGDPLDLRGARHHRRRSRANPGHHRTAHRAGRRRRRGRGGHPQDCRATPASRCQPS